MSSIPLRSENTEPGILSPNVPMYSKTSERARESSNPYASSQHILEKQRRDDWTISTMLYKIRGKLLATTLIAGGVLVVALLNKNHDPNVTPFGSVKYDKYTEGLKNGGSSGKVEKTARSALEDIIVEMKTLKGEPNR